MTTQLANPTPRGYRRTDPDETLGRLLYRQLAERDARVSMARSRRVSLTDSDATAPKSVKRRMGL